MDIKPDAPVELAVLLKKIVYEMKKINITHVIQQVEKKDWKEILKPQGFFSYVDINKDGYVIVKCELDKFPEAVMHAMGFSILN
jgi:hypothetical protein